MTLRCLPRNAASRDGPRGAEWRGRAEPCRLCGPATRTGDARACRRAGWGPCARVGWPVRRSRTRGLQGYAPANHPARRLLDGALAKVAAAVLHAPSARPRASGAYGGCRVSVSELVGKGWWSSLLASEICIYKMYPTGLTGRCRGGASSWRGRASSAAAEAGGATLQVRWSERAPAAMTFAWRSAGSEETRSCWRGSSRERRLCPRA